MGAAGSKKRDISIHYDQWKKVKQGLMYDVMKSNSGEEGQLYHFTLDQSKDSLHQMKIYQERTKLSKNIVDVLGVDLLEQGYGFCGNTKLIKVLTQRIPQTLGQTGKLNMQEATIVLYNSLGGFQRLHKEFIFTQINDRMIGFTPNGATKVWIQQNYGMNYSISGNNKQLNDNEREREIVKNVIQVVQEKYQNGKFNQPFRRDLYSNSNFRSAISFITQSKIVSEEVLNRNIINIGQGRMEAVLGNGNTETVFPLMPVRSFVRPQEENTSFNKVGYTVNGPSFVNQPISPRQFNNPISTSSQKSNSKIRFTYDQTNVISQGNLGYNQQYYRS